MNRLESMRVLLAVVAGGLERSSQPGPWTTAAIAHLETRGPGWRPGRHPASAAIGERRNDRRTTQRDHVVVHLPLLMVSDEIREGKLLHLLPGWAPKRHVVHAVYPLDTSPTRP
jgi:hypothetical protein